MGQGSLEYEIIPPKIQRQECTSEIMRRPRPGPCFSPSPPLPLPELPSRSFPQVLPSPPPKRAPKAPNILSLRRKEPTYRGRRNAPTESSKTIIPRALSRSYKERLHHLCKVTEAFLPRASSSPYIGDLDAPSEGLTALMRRGILAIYNKLIGGEEERRSSRPRGGTSLPSCARETYYRRT